MVYRHERKDVTKNFELGEGQKVIENLLSETFLIANLFTVKNDFTLEIRGQKTKLQTKKPSFKNLPERKHDKPKPKLTSETDYLVELDVLDKSGRPKKGKSDKYKQIQKFVEIADALIRKNPKISQSKSLKIYDMGSGKGYLTFALYDYLTNTAKIQSEIKGIEIRDDLVDFCNQISQKVGFENLSFEKGFINNFDLPETDILIALHACDTATDDAIFKGIQANAQLIICAPCCHKQIRKQLNAAEPLNSITDFGILKERQSEIVTDTIRALLLEASGYKTKVFEFISTEHTGKNVMIVGEQKGDFSKKEMYLKKVEELKKTFGIDFHYLETLLN